MATSWWPIPWTRPPKGSPSARVTLRNGRTFELFDDEGRHNGFVPASTTGRSFAYAPRGVKGNRKPVIRYEVREIVNGVMAPTYDHVDSLLELRALLTSLEQE